MAGFQLVVLNTTLNCLHRDPQGSPSGLHNDYLPFSYLLRTKYFKL